VKPLVALFLAVEALDLVTFLQAPAFEANPLMRALPVAGVVAVKVTLVLLAVAIAARIRTPSLRSFALGVGIAIGAFGVGTGVATILGASRPATEPAPIPSGATGYATDAVVPAAPTAWSRTAVPHPAATGPAFAIAGAGPRVLHGRASWYRASGMVAAAGPRLRAFLGHDWRGATVQVCSRQRACATVTLRDWCQCLRGEPGERLIDLSDDAFARLAPLPVGLVKVSIAAAIAPPQTDAAP
jgi:hypothetical protein